MTFIRQIANYVLESKELGVTVTEIKVTSPIRTKIDFINYHLTYF